MSIDIGMDLGASGILIYVRGKGIVVKEPAIAATDREGKEVIATGEEAFSLIRRGGGNVIEVRPLERGKLKDPVAAKKMIHDMLQKALGPMNLRRPRVCIGFPGNMLEEEKQKIIDMTMESGARKVIAVERPVAAALGSGIDLTKTQGNILIDFGFGLTEITILSGKEIMTSQIIEYGGMDFNQAIITYFKEVYGLLIGERLAEELKLQCGMKYLNNLEDVIFISGRDVKTGMEKEGNVLRKEISKVLHKQMMKWIPDILSVVKQVPKEMEEEVFHRGVVLTGGGALMMGMERLIEEAIGLSVITPEQPMYAVAVGAGKYFEQLQPKKRFRIGRLSF